MEEKVAQVEGLAFIAPVSWLGFPAILKGWIERDFTYGFACYLTPEGWRGDLRGRVPLLHPKKPWLSSMNSLPDRWTRCASLPCGRKSAGRACRSRARYAAPKAALSQDPTR